MHTYIYIKCIPDQAREVVSGPDLSSADHERNIRAKPKRNKLMVDRALHTFKVHIIYDANEKKALFIFVYHCK